MTSWIHRFLLTLFLLANVQASRADDTEPLIFGVFPYVTAKHIVETYRPIAYALEKRLKRRVLLYTARDFKTFADRTQQGEYDILLTAPHLAWLAKQDAHYRPILQYSNRIKGLLVVQSNSAFDSPEALRGRTIATVAPTAMVVLSIQDELAARGIKSNVDYQSINAGTHINAAMQVVNTRADAAILAEQLFKTLRPEYRQQLRILRETRPLPGLVYLTHPKFSVQESDAISQAFLTYVKSVRGQAFLKRGNHGSLSTASDEDLQSVQSYALQARDILQRIR